MIPPFDRDVFCEGGKCLSSKVLLALLFLERRVEIVNGYDVFVSLLLPMAINKEGIEEVLKTLNLALKAMNYSGEGKGTISLLMRGGGAVTWDINTASGILCSSVLWYVVNNKGPFRLGIGHVTPE
jgi:hypothetical protein